MLGGMPEVRLIQIPASYLAAPCEDIFGAIVPKKCFTRNILVDCSDHRWVSAGKKIHSGFAGGEAKMAARLRAIAHADCDGRSSRPAVAGRVRDAGAEFDADTAADPLANGGFLDRRAACGASLGRARRGLVTGLKLVGPRRFSRPKANSGGATAD
jgi:hypothetical protein